MTQSSEYPDLKWMPPASWTNANRTAVQLVVIHTTEGSEGPTSAEDGASYDQRRTDGTSTHYFHDSDSTVQCVLTADQAHAARTQGNKRGIQHELCGRAGQGGTGWADAVSQGTLRQAAKQCARDAKRWGIPVRHLTVAQVAAGEKGFCGHIDVTYAFPQDNGTHTDPGTMFPWSQFLDMVRAEMEDFPMDQEAFNALMTGWANSGQMNGHTTDLTTGVKKDVKRSLSGTLDALVAVDLQGDPDDSLTSLLGKNALNQGVPNPLAKVLRPTTDAAVRKTTMWQLLEDVAEGLAKVLDKPAPTA